MTDRADMYAGAFYDVIVAEGNVNEVQDELFRFSRTLEANDELREKLADPTIPTAVRTQIVEDLLGGKALPTTTALVSLVVTTGRVRELPRIVEELLERTASLTDRSVAEVRSAVELTDDQKQRLAAAIKQSTGKDVDIVVVVDPTVLGGVVTQIGDTVIDGSVRQRLTQLRETF